MSFKAIVSVPCFELWLLLHFVDIQASLHRHEALKKLKKELPDYQKGKSGMYQKTVMKFDDATRRAKSLRDLYSCLPGTDPYTNVDELVDDMRTLNNNKSSV